MAGKIGMELNLVVGKIDFVSPNFTPPTFNTCDKTQLLILMKPHFYE